MGKEELEKIESKTDNNNTPPENHIILDKKESYSDLNSNLPQPYSDQFSLGCQTRQQKNCLKCTIARMAWMKNSNQLTDAAKNNFESRIKSLKEQIKYNTDKLSQIQKDSKSVAPALPISVTRNPIYNRLSQRQEDLMCNLVLMKQKYDYYSSNNQLETYAAKRLVQAKQMSKGKLL